MSVNKNNSTYTKFFTRSPNLSYANPKYSIFPKPVRKSTPSPLPFTQKKQNKIFSPYNIMTKPNNKRNPFNSITTSVKSNSLNTSHINNTSLNDSSMRKFNHITTSNKLIQNRRAKTPNIPQKSSSKLNWVSLSSRASPNINTKHITKINSANNNMLNKAKSPFTSKLNMVTNNNYQRKIQHRNFQPKNIFSKYKPKQTSTVIIASEASKMNNASNTNKTFFANSNNISVPEKDNSTSSDSTNNKSKEINREISQGKIDKKISKNKKRIKCMHDLSKTGLAGDEKKVNQDNYFIFKNFNNDFENIFMGVCDGHGYYGHEVSGYIKENLPMDLNHKIKSQKLDIKKDDLKSIIIDAFVTENYSLLRNRNIDSTLSGSTCVSAIYTPEKLIIANIGDSRIVLGKIDKNGRWIAENLSRDHKPTCPDEAERIKSKGGRIRQMKDDDGTFIGPMRVYMKDKDMPGLAMTRSFGDSFAATAGTISIPEITEHVFKEEDKFIVLASDGLYEFIDSEEVVSIVKGYYVKEDIVGCCEYLYKESCRRWLKEEEDTIDDITIIIVFFE